MKLRAFQKRLRINSVDVGLFFDESHVRYFAEADTGCLAIPDTGKPVLFVPGFEADRVKETATVRVEKVGRDWFSAVAKKFPANRLGIISSAVSFARAQNVKKEWKARLVDMSATCTALRMVKTREEIKRITHACALTDMIFDEFCALLPGCKTEVDASGALLKLMAQCGVQPSFDPVVASGKNGSLPHHQPSFAKLSGFTVVDFGVRAKNYCSDMTRMIFAGKPSKKQCDIYDSFVSVQEKCVDLLEQSKTLDEVDALAKNCMGSSMIHYVGHSLGVDVHDAQIRPLPLLPGIVTTIEPGTYQKQYGLRVEDDVVLTKKGPQVLTRSSKDLIILGRNL